MRLNFACILAASALLCLSGCGEQKYKPKPKPEKPKSCEVQLFIDQQFGGASITFVQDVSSVSPPFHDQITSARVKRGTWRFFADTGYGQSMGDYPPGDYPKLNPNDQLDSLKCLSPG